MNASVKSAIAAPSGNGDSQAIIERNPDYDSWESERTALILRLRELSALADGASGAAAEAAYLAAESEGYSAEYCQEQADKVHAKCRDIRTEQASVNARLSIIKPFVTRERMETNRLADKDDFKPRLLAYLERLATAVEKIERKLAKV